MKRALLTMTLAVLIWCAGANASPAPRLSHAGRWITDAKGRVVVLHGFNMVYKLAPYYPAAIGFGADDAAFLARLGFNVVRVGVIWKAVEPHPGVYDDHYLAHIAGTVRTLAAHGVASLLDFHQDMYNEVFQGEGAPDWAVESDGLPGAHNGFPGNYYTSPALQRAEDHFWANSPGPGGTGLQDRYAAAWRHTAKVFRTVRGVLGYELFNEPSAGTLFLSCLSTGCPTFDAQVTALDARVAGAIRAVDKRTLIFYEPDVGFDFGTDTHVGALRAGPTGFAFHDYCLSASSSGCPSESQPLANAVARSSRSTRDALLLDEFGANPFAGDLTRMTGLADQYMVPWVEWAYCSCGDPTTSGPGDQQAFVRNPARPPRGTNLMHPTYPVLVEPFPHLIAGTPLAWGFDRQTKVFRLSYSTAKANGRGRFGRGTVTDIATPRVVYSKRYAVHVHGGAIVSAPGARVLKVAACRGARTITVTVLPRGRNRASCRLR